MISEYFTQLAVSSHSKIDLSSDLIVTVLSLSLSLSVSVHGQYFTQPCLPTVKVSSVVTVLSLSLSVHGQYFTQPCLPTVKVSSAVTVKAPIHYLALPYGSAVCQMSDVCV